jgi:macrolide transport system ATP-binding/permease protein
VLPVSDWEDIYCSSIRLIGVPVALLCVWYVRAQLYEVTSANPLVMIAAIVTLAAAAGVAGLIPAQRAASTDPVQALGTE